MLGRRNNEGEGNGTKMEDELRKSQVNVMHDV